MNILAIDLGGTKVNVGMINPDNHVIDSMKFDSVVTSQYEALENIFQCIDTFMDSHSFNDIGAISICLVGRVDSKSGIWIEIDPNRSAPINVVSKVRSRYKTPCFILNDVNASAHAELKFGIGKTSQNFVYYNVGTGIAASIVHDGAVMSGSHFDSGEIGHSVFHMNDDFKYQSIEDVGSGLGMVRQCFALKEHYPASCVFEFEDGLSFKDILECYSRNDALASFVIHQAIRGIIVSFISLARTVDPEYIVVGGGVTNSDVFYNLLIRSIPEHELRFLRGKIVRTQLDNQSIGIRGCAAFAQDQEA